MRRYEMWMSFAAMVVAAGCGGAGAGDKETGFVQASAALVPGASSAQPEPGTPSAPVRLQFTVKEIDVHVVPIETIDNEEVAGVEPGKEGEHADGVEEIGEPDDGGKWLTIAGARQIDLSAGIATEITFEPTIIPAGRITQTRLVLEGDAVLWIGSERVTLVCPSCSTSGLKLVSRDDVIVPPGGGVLLKLMFDLEMLGQKHGGGFQLGPVVHVEASALPSSPTIP